MDSTRPISSPLAFHFKLSKADYPTQMKTARIWKRFHMPRLRAVSCTR